MNKVFEFTHDAMTTEFSIFVAGDHEQNYARQSTDACFREIDRLEGMLSKFNPCGDVGQINALRSGESVKVSADTMECLVTALWVYSETDGAFDPSVGPLVSFYRDNNGWNINGDKDQLTALSARTGMDRIIIDPNTFSVTCKNDDCGSLGLDLGGIGKGYALDKVADILEEWEIRDVLLNAGTSTVLSVGTDGEHDGWNVGVAGDWGASKGVGSICLKDMALSGSGLEVKGSHIINPSTGNTDILQKATWSVAPSSSVADALSTAFMVMDTDSIKKLCNRQSYIKAYMVDEKGVLTVV